MEEGEWTLVRRKKPQRKQRTEAISDKHWRRDQTREVSYYFSEFPENFGAIEMYRLFKKYGRVVGVVIPPKRNRSRRRFGFARFVGVTDPKLFGIKLDNIIIGATKIFVNTPRLKGKAQMVGRFSSHDLVRHAETSNKIGKVK